MIRHTVLAAAALMISATSAFAYQVTGPVVAIDDSKITVTKGKEKWEIAKGSAEIPADVKVGSKVTIEYTMTATKVVNKDAKK